MITTVVDLDTMLQIKQELDAMNGIEWTKINLGRCLNEYRATVQVIGGIQETVDYVKGLSHRPYGQGFKYIVLDDVIEFIVTCDSSD